MARLGYNNWEEVYQKEKVEDMPWYNEDIDTDLELEIKKRSLKKGRFLDLGTGPGTQAARMAEIGFDVTGSDISPTAIEKARKLHGKVSFVVDDILHTKLHKTFDYIFDRGCFHVLEPEERNPYIQNVKKLLSDKGILFLKCFSTKEINDKGPHRFSHEDIKKIFSRDFIIESIKDTLYQGRSSMSPKALFCVLKKK